MTLGSRQLLQRGIQAAKSGHRAAARELLLRAIEQDDHDESAWLWLSGVIDDPGEQIICLENVLTINPANSAARSGLGMLRTKITEKGTQEPVMHPATQNSHAGCQTTDAAHPCPTLQATPGTSSQTGDSIPSRICSHCGTANPGWRDLCCLCGKMIDGSAEIVTLEPPDHAVDLAAEEEFSFLDDYDAQHQRMVTLIAAWTAALSFNKRRAYEYEILSASAGRTVSGVIIGGIAIPCVLILFVGLVLIASSVGDTMSLLGNIAATPLVLVSAGIPVAIGLVVSFYLYAAVLYLFCWALGGKASFVVHAHLLSVAHSASSLLTASLVVAASMLGLALIESSSHGIGSIGLVLPVAAGLVSTIHMIAMQGQAISVAHRLSWQGGIAIVLGTDIVLGLVGTLLWLASMAISPQQQAFFTLIIP